MSIPVIMRHFATDFSFKDAFQRSVISYLFEGDRLQSYKPSIEFNNISRYFKMKNAKKSAFILIIRFI